MSDLVLIERHYLENIACAAAMLEGSTSIIDRRDGEVLRKIVKSAVPAERAAGGVDVTDEMVERGAEAHWIAAPHQVLERSGFPTDWASQPESVKRDYRKYARASLSAALSPRADSAGGA